MHYIDGLPKAEVPPCKSKILYVTMVDIYGEITGVIK